METYNWRSPSSPKEVEPPGFVTSAVAIAMVSLAITAAYWAGVGGFWLGLAFPGWANPLVSAIGSAVLGGIAGAMLTAGAVSSLADWAIRRIWRS